MVDTYEYFDFLPTSLTHTQPSYSNAYTYGNVGGATSSVTYSLAATGGGGGGAGSAGQSGTGTGAPCGNGGSGITYFGIQLAGGGGGGTHYGTPPAGVGIYGGGNGNTCNCGGECDGTPGTPNTGGGKMPYPCVSLLSATWKKICALI